MADAELACPQESSGAGLDHCVAERFWKASTEMEASARAFGGYAGARGSWELRASFPRASAHQKKPWAFVE
ncbi:hypothetical protein MTY66_16500 [Mycolicibacterium sp. TY66]|nr:hypothetical protein MTY66_16500 [Mycolicibacterium sp. TY66]